MLVYLSTILPLRSVRVADKIGAFLLTEILTLSEAGLGDKFNSTSASDRSLVEDTTEALQGKSKQKELELQR